MIYLKTVTLRERVGLNSFRLFVFVITTALIHLSSSCFAQQKKEPADSLLRLLEANSAQLKEIDSVSYRKVVGPARFLHNNTYLLCDTALWNINTNIIDAIGHVQIIQENTFLKSDRIEYVINDNLAKFRGQIVELFDKEGNILKTNYLDYNTKDSIATFYNGGALINNDGNLIESINGVYNSKDKLFSFEDNVQMFADSIFIISNKIDYKTDINKAYFGESTTAWQNENMLYANSGEFDRPKEIFIFDKDGYIFTREQEIWADLIKYYKKTSDADLYNNVQILDTVQTSIALSDKATYRPNPMVIELTLKPVVGLYNVENGVKDTLFMASDTIKYYTKRYCDIDSSIISQAKVRKELSDIDPISIINAKEHKDAIRRASKSANTPAADSTKQKPPLLGSKKLSGDKDSTIAHKTDSLVAPIIQDTINVIKDTINIIKDTTKIAFVDAFHNVRIYRSNLQGICDSLVYTGIDSIARFYKDPVMWNDIKHQFTADSIQAVLRNNALNKVNLLSNAYIISQEDSIHFNQIKSTEMTAHFANNDLYRFDALGGASAIFYLQEDSVVTVMNQKESKLLSANIKDRQIQKIKYIENIKSDALPVFNLPLDQQKLRGFNWREQDRPKTRNEVTERIVKKSKRLSLKETPFPEYHYSKVYFPQRRDSIMAYKSYSDSIIKAQEAQREMERLEKERIEREKAAIKDTTGVVVADTVIIKEKIETENNISVDNSTKSKIKNADNRIKRKEARREKRLFKKEQRRLKKEQKRLEKEQNKVSKI